MLSLMSPLPLNFRLDPRAEWNGRSFIDNAPNVMFSIAANTPVGLGIGKESVTSKPSKTFPYVPAASESRKAGA
jgi:hypothetical protein